MNHTKNSGLVIYGKPNCPFCTKAVRLAESKNMKFRYLVLGVDYDRQYLLDLVPNARSVPQIFIDENHIGGFNEFQAHLK